MRAVGLARGAFIGLALVGAGQAEPVRVERLTFEGVVAVNESDLRDALETRPWPLLPWNEKRPFDEETFQADLGRIIEFYTNRGYPEARLTAADIQPSADGRSVKLSIVVSEGRPVLIESIDLEGFDPLPAREWEALRQQLPIAVGQPLDRDRLTAAVQLALFRLGDDGYAYARVDIAERTGASLFSRRVTLLAQPGLPTLFGPIEIVGNSGLDDALIRRDLVYRPGEMFRAILLRESEARLTASELIKTATVEFVQRDGEPGDVHTRVRVEEAEHRQFTFSGGYGSEGQLDVTGTLQHLNFFGGARTAGIEGRWSTIDRGLLVDFVEPRFIDPRYSLRVAGQGQFVDEPTFRARRAGTALSLTRRFGPLWPPDVSRTTAAVSYTSSFGKFETSDDFTLDLEDAEDLIGLGLDPVTGLGEGRLSAVSIDLGRQTTRDPLNPQQGYSAVLHFEQAGRWLGGRFTFNEVRADLRHYTPLTDRFVLANRLRVGTLDEPSGAGVVEDGPVGPPLFKRYFLGGARGPRGWGRNEIGPRTETGLPLGGLSHLDLSTELRWSRLDGLGAVVFVDAGNVWDRSWRVDLGNLRSSVGAGLRLPTPFGLARIDYGYQLTLIAGLLVEGAPETRRWRVHIRIGQAF